MRESTVIEMLTFDVGKIATDLLLLTFIESDNFFLRATNIRLIPLSVTIYGILVIGCVRHIQVTKLLSSSIIY